MTTAELREGLLEIGFRFGRPGLHFADNQTANNKLDLGYDVLSQYPDLRDEVVDRMAIIMKRNKYSPDFVIGVPDGATGLATQLASVTGAEYNPRLKKNPKTKTLSHATEVDREIVESLETGVLVEDVLNRRSSTRRTLRLQGLGNKVVAVMAVFDRGIPNERYEIFQPVHSIVSHPIPAELPQIHKLWQHAS